MKNILLVIAALLFFCSPSYGQETPSKVEIFGGYSYLRLQGKGLGRFDGIKDSRSNQLNGFSTSVTGNITNNFGAVLEFSGYYTDKLKTFDCCGNQIDIKRDTTAYSLLAGPKFRIRNTKRATPFLQALFGILRANGIQTPFLTGNPQVLYAMALGGGLDVKVNKNFAVRAIQVDYFFTRNYGLDLLPGLKEQHNLRLSTGIVFNFGKLKK